MYVRVACLNQRACVGGAGLSEFLGQRPCQVMVWCMEGLAKYLQDEDGASQQAPALQGHPLHRTMCTQHTHDLFSARVFTSVVARWLLRAAACWYVARHESDKFMFSVWPSSSDD